MTFLGADLSLTIKGQLPSGKNAVQITRTGRRYPAKRFELWKADASKQVLAQISVRANMGPFTITRPVKATIRYWPGNLIRRDATGICDAIWHLLEHLKIIHDDALIRSIDYRQMPLDRANPRAEIELKVLS